MPWWETISQEIKVASVYHKSRHYAKKWYTKNHDTLAKKNINGLLGNWMWNFNQIRFSSPRKKLELSRTISLVAPVLPQIFSTDPN